MDVVSPSNWEVSKEIVMQTNISRLIRRSFIFLFLILSFLGHASTNERAIRFLGEFSNLRLTAEHSYGYSVQLWQSGNDLFGLLLSSNGLSGDTPTGQLEDVHFDSRKGFSSSLMCPCHRAVANTPPKWFAASVSLRRAMLPSSSFERFGLWGEYFSRLLRVHFSLRPDDLLTILKMALSIGERYGFPLPLYPSYEVLTFTSVGFASH